MEVILSPTPPDPTDPNPQFEVFQREELLSKKYDSLPPLQKWVYSMLSANPDLDIRTALAIAKSYLEVNPSPASPPDSPPPPGPYPSPDRLGEDVWSELPPEYTPATHPTLFRVLAHENTPVLDYRQASTIADLKGLLSGRIPVKPTIKRLTIGMALSLAHSLIKVRETGGMVEKGEDGVYHAISEDALRDEVAALYDECFPKTRTTRDVNESLIDLLDTPNEIIPEIPRTWLQITPTLYYNTEEATMYTRDQLPTNARVFARLYDTPSTSGAQVQVPLSYLVGKTRFDDGLTFEAVLLDQYHRTLTALNKDPLNPPHYNAVIDSWANKSNDVYRDILYFFSDIFQPPDAHQRGSWFFLGTGTNGKSACIDLARSLIGTANSTSIPLNEMGRPEYADPLSRTWLNCPSESNESIVDDQRTFRIVSAHEELTVKKYYSQSARTIRCFFTGAYPVNHIPQWTGDSAEACVRRTLAIPFTNDYSRTMSAGDDWAKKTYTPRFMAELTGEVLAYTTYYSDPAHRWVPTLTMQHQQNIVKSKSSPARVFEEHFSRYFSGFTSPLSFIQMEADNWCNANDFKHFKIQRTDLLWGQYDGITMRFGGAVKKTYRRPDKTTLPVFHPQMEIQARVGDKYETLSVGEYLSRTVTGSVVEALDQAWDAYLKQDYAAFADRLIVLDAPSLDQPPDLPPPPGSQQELPLDKKKG